MALILALFVVLGWTPITNAAEYTVKSGDNLWKIAQQYNTTVANIKEMNKISSDKLDIGHKLQVPDIKTKTASTVNTSAAVSRSGRDSASSAPAGTEPTVSSSITPSRGAIIRRDVITNSFALLGKPYRYGGMSPKGFDCSGFVSYIFKISGISLPHQSAGQYGKGIAVEKSKLITGDLVFFRTGGSKRINHVGIYIGDDRFIHAASSRGIVTESLKSKYYSKCYAGAKRIIES
jgi:peptidoglycan endopeptidase LytE